MGFFYTGGQVEPNMIVDLREIPFSLKKASGTWLLIGEHNGRGGVVFEGRDLRPTHTRPRARHVRNLTELWFDLEALPLGFSVHVVSEVLPKPDATMCELHEGKLFHDRKAQEIVFVEKGFALAFPAEDFTGVPPEEERVTEWDLLLRDDLIIRKQ